MTTTANSEGEEDYEYKLESIVPSNVGHLLDDPVEFVCPACQQQSLTKIKRQPVTFIQRIVSFINCCLCCSPIKWSGRYDVNHYCGKCGCYIGRKITLSWYKRQLFRNQNSEVESSGRWQKFTKVGKEQIDKKKQKHSTMASNDRNDNAASQDQ